MFFPALLFSALAALCHSQTCQEESASSPADVSFLQHALQLGDLSPGGSPAIQTHSLFVKFHKVAGSTWRAYVDAMQGESKNCTMKCGNLDWVCTQMFPSGSKTLAACLRVKAHGAMDRACSTVPRSCTFHQSLGVIRQAVSGQSLSVANASDLAGVANLWPDTKRLGLLWNVDWARAWLPGNFHNKRILITTILRDPAERIRSYYYYYNEGPTHEGFKAFLEFRRDFVAGNVTQELLEKQMTDGDVRERGFSTMPILYRSCCEYETWLGDGSVERSKLVLSTQFDLVGITERMNDALVALGRLYGLSAEETAELGKTVNTYSNTNTENKLDWNDEELRLATFVAEKGKKIYDFAQEIFRRQYLSLFGSEEALQAAVQTFESLNPASLE